MATQTTYYEFNKPSGTDLVNPLVDTNPNWDIADSALHELNERSVANCTEVVSLGVHALSTLNTDTKFLKWIATANYTAGETFTLNGVAVAAATPSGASLATNAYVAGAVVMACLNADNTAMTVFLSGTTVASDSERLGGELPSYYATDSDMDNAQTDITNIQNTLGNTSIVGIGDGTVTGAIEAINSALPDYDDTIYSTTERQIGTYNGEVLYRKNLYISAFPNASNQQYPHGITNLKQLVHLYGYANSGNITLTVPSVASSAFEIQVSRNGANISITTGGNLSTYSGYITLEYTKSV